MTSRVARRTYGTVCTEPFDNYLHDPNKLHINEYGQARCKDVLSVFVQIGDEIEIGSTMEKIYTLRKSVHNPCCKIYSMDRKADDQVEYVDHPDVTQLGEIKIFAPNPRGLKSRDLVLRMTFSGAEIVCEAIDTTSSSTCSTTTDFLSESNDTNHNE